MKLKRGLSDTWTVREQLYLASSVLKSGDQNWMSVSRALKPLVEKESLRPPDWFSQKSCAVQYASLLENTNTPKRKKRESGETTSESIVRRLTQERLGELSQNLVYQKDEYLRLKTDVNLLLSGSITDEMLEKMWRDMEQEEREADLAKRAHMMLMLKHQQQQRHELNSAASLSNQTRKIAEGTMETAQSSFTPTEVPTENDDEKKSNRGGRSPLLTSLLKSPSPTTQTIQSFPSTPGNSVSVTSPTITSLLGSSPKILNAQLAQNVSPQLQQLVSTAIASANASTERPSVGAPTLSMLLEMPTSAQRGPLPNLQTPIVSHAQQQQQQQQIPVTVSISAGMHNNFQQTVQPQPQVHRVAVQNELTNATVVAKVPTTLSTATTVANIATAPTNISTSENMVQIIDNIDDVIRKDMKDIMVDVMDKDEINEIIGDIEELIKEEITGSPQTLGTSSATTTATPAVIGGVSQQATDIPIVTAQVKSESRDVDEAVSLSDSPHSEMAIEEIDSSTSNIAEIIGTVAIESQESKIIVSEITETVSNPPEVKKSETSTFDEKMALSKELVSKSKTNDAENKKTVPTEEKHLDVEVKPVDGVASNAETEAKDSKLVDEEARKTTKETVEKEVAEADEEEDEIEVIVPNNKESSESVKEQKEPAMEDNEGKDNAGLDQLEMHLAKITGDQQDAVPSAEIVSVSSEVTNDMPSAEDTEKSQDISLILEDDESSQNSEIKKKPVAEEQVVENTVESAESSESFKDRVLIKEEIAEVKEELSVKSSQEEETVEETVEIITEEVVKKEDVKDSSEDTTTSVVKEIEIKKEISTEPIQTIEDTTEVVIVKSEPDVETEVVDVEANNKSDNIENKSKELKTETALEDKPLSSFRSTEEIKKEPKINVKEEEEEKEIKIEVKEEKEETTKKNAEGRQSVKKETEPAVVEESGELDEEESSLSKLSSGRAMKTYSKRQSVAVDSETENESTGEGADYRAWKKAVMLVYNRLATHKYASVFLRPITEDQAPGYHSVIFRPMDLSTVKKNIDNGTIRSTMHFQRDVMLMFQNAIMYNKHDTVIYKMAISMQEECLQHMQVRTTVYLM